MVLLELFLSATQSTLHSGPAERPGVFGSRVPNRANARPIQSLPRPPAAYRTHPAEFSGKRVVRTRPQSHLLPGAGVRHPLSFSMRLSRLEPVGWLALTCVVLRACVPWGWRNGRASVPRVSYKLVPPRFNPGPGFEEWLTDAVGEEFDPVIGQTTDSEGEVW